MSSPPTGVTRRRTYADISPYAPELHACEIDLSDNTNLWGMPPASARALQTAPATAATRYPSAYASSLTHALAAYLDVAAENIVTGCGSDDVLDAAIRAFAEPGDRIAIPDPSFAMIPTFARLSGLDPFLVPLTTGYDVDVQGMLDADAKIIYLCSPNNPTGARLSRASIDAIVERSTGLVIIDEAYAEFARESVLDLAMSTERVLVTRTMSKAFGLAGLRIGYAVGARSLVDEVAKARGPFKISAIAERAAVAALTESLDWVHETAALAIANRTRFVDAIESLGIAALPSDANFVFVPLANAQAVAARLRDAGIAVRAFSGLRAPRGSSLAACNGDALRITIGPWDTMQRVVDALREVLR